MRLAVFGETNRTKHYLVKRALDAGYAVNVLESPESEHRRGRKGLTSFVGEIDNTKSMDKVMKNADAAVCLLQGTQDDFDDKAEEIIRSLISCMEANFVRRLVIFSYVKTETRQKAPQNGRLRLALIPTISRQRYRYRSFSIFARRIQKMTSVRKLLFFPRLVYRSYISQFVIYFNHCLRV